MDTEVEQSATEQDTGVEQETEAQPTVSTDSMVDKIIDGNNIGAKSDFEALIADKLNAALELKKQELAQSLYGDKEAEAEVETEEEPEPEEQEAQ